MASRCRERDLQTLVCVSLSASDFGFTVSSPCVFFSPSSQKNCHQDWKEEKTKAGVLGGGVGWRPAPSTLFERCGLCKRQRAHTHKQTVQADMILKMAAQRIISGSSVWTRRVICIWRKTLTSGNAKLWKLWSTVCLNMRNTLYVELCAADCWENLTLVHTAEAQWASGTRTRSYMHRWQKASSLTWHT